MYDLSDSYAYSYHSCVIIIDPASSSRCSDPLGWRRDVGAAAHVFSDTERGEMNRGLCVDRIQQKQQKGCSRRQGSVSPVRFLFNPFAVLRNVIAEEGSTCLRPLTHTVCVGALFAV